MVHGGGRLPVEARGSPEKLGGNQFRPWSPTRLGPYKALTDQKGLEIGGILMRSPTSFMRDCKKMCWGQGNTDMTQQEKGGKLSVLRVFWGPRNFAGAKSDLLVPGKSMFDLFGIMLLRTPVHFGHFLKTHKRNLNAGTELGALGAKDDSYLGGGLDDGKGQKRKSDMGRIGDEQAGSEGDKFATASSDLADSFSKRLVLDRDTMLSDASRNMLESNVGVRIVKKKPRKKVNGKERKGKLFYSLWGWPRKQKENQVWELREKNKKGRMEIDPNQARAKKQKKEENGDSLEGGGKFKMTHFAIKIDSDEILLSSGLEQEARFFSLKRARLARNSLQEEVWEKLKNLFASNPGPTILLGDFNQIEFADQKLGVRKYLPGARAFSVWRISSGLIELPTRGPAFTWCNNRETSDLIFEQLDRAYSNEEWRCLFPEAYIFPQPVGTGVLTGKRNWASHGTNLRKINGDKGGTHKGWFGVIEVKKRKQCQEKAKDQLINRDFENQPEKPKYVSDIIDGQSWNANKVWNWFKRESAQRILSTYLPTEEKEDEIIWCQEENGDYSALENTDVSKMENVLLEVGSQCLPTKEKLSKRKITQNSSCAICGKVESASHLFLYCEVSKRIWSGSSLGLNIPESPRLEISTWFKNFFNYLTEEGSNPNPGWALLIANLWAIWTHRNNVIFRKAAVNPYGVMEVAKVEMERWYYGFGSKGPEDRMQVKDPCPTIVEADQITPRVGHTMPRLPTTPHVLSEPIICVKCGAKKFMCESLQFCCGDGEVRVATNTYPIDLLRLFTSEDEDSVDFWT
ncbi:Hydroxycarboxylic acid receptor 3 [Bienertia sinuspersici]